MAAKCKMCRERGHNVPDCPSLQAMANLACSSSSLWLLDSGVSHNLVSDIGKMTIHYEYDGTEEIHLADGSGLPITHAGISILTSPSSNFILNNVLCVRPPSATYSLFINSLKRTKFL